MVEERTVFKVEVSQDGLRARLFLEGRREGFVYEIKAKGVRSKTGKPLHYDFGYYTLNNIPDGERIETDHSNHDAGAVTSTVAVASAKRITKMPSSWLNGPDQVVKIGTTHGMRFDTKSVTVKAGSKIKLELNNPDDMMHNFLLVQPNSATRVGKLAEELGLKGHSKGYVPESDLVLTYFFIGA